MTFVMKERRDSIYHNELLYIFTKADSQYTYSFYATLYLTLSCAKFFILIFNKYFSYIFEKLTLFYMECYGFNRSVKSTLVFGP